MGLESKELFLLAEIAEHPYPAELATTLNMPKATVTVYLKRLEAAGFVRREIDPSDLRRHRLLLTATGRKAAAGGMSALSEEFNKRSRGASRIRAADGPLKNLYKRKINDRLHPARIGTRRV